jgi:hypothetical protein
MKKYWFFILCTTFLISCKSEHPSDFITFSGNIENTKDSTLTIVGKGFNKIIKISEDGSFKDTLKISEANLFNLYSPNKWKRNCFFKKWIRFKINW